MGRGHRMRPRRRIVMERVFLPAERGQKGHGDAKDYTLILTPPRLVVKTAAGKGNVSYLVSVVGQGFSPAVKAVKTQTSMSALRKQDGKSLFSFSPDTKYLTLPLIP